MKNRSQLVLEWYCIHQRILPWRENKNPYYIWISEIMLQQTKVETVKPYFKRFIQQLPTLLDLANCHEDDLMKLWQGLGYYRRVLNMQKAAILCVKEYDGKLPNNYQQLLTLPGIGNYTAGAIASIAYNEEVYAIDGNVLRIYSRLHDLHEDIMVLKTKKIIEQYVSEDMNNQMGDYNQALMDIGATICTPLSPKCKDCPISSTCLAYKQNTVQLLPIKKRKKKASEHTYTIVIHQYKDKILLHRRDKDGLLANLYEFETIKEEMVLSEPYISLGSYKHIFSHQIWNMQGYLVEHDYEIEKEDFFWVTYQEMIDKYSIPGAFLPFVQRITERREKHAT